MRKPGLVFLTTSLLLAALLASACERADRGVQAARETVEADDRAAAMTTADKDFMRRASESHIQEIDMAKLAMERSTNADVRDYAQMLERDHMAALEKLNTLMDAHGLPMRRESSDKTHVESLSKLAPEQFDKGYVGMMAQNHQKSLDSYRGALNTTQNQELRNYITTVIPTIETHLSKAQQLQQQMTRPKRT